MSLGSIWALRRLSASLTSRRRTPKTTKAKGYLAGDRLYTGQDANWFQIPATEAGYGLSLEYRDDQLGCQLAHTSGMAMIEGGWHCPAMTPDLVNATADFRANRITATQYQAKITQRNTYRMRVKDTPDQAGTGRLRCPAAGTHPTAVCVLKPASMAERKTRQPDGTLTDARPQITPHGPAFDRGTPPVCASESVTVKIEDGAKYRQAETYGTKKQGAIFRALRSTQEGGHGFAKDEAQEALDAPGRRRVRGKAPQSIFAALLLAAANLRKISSFTLQAVDDRDTGTYYVIKNDQKRPDRWSVDPSSDSSDPPDPGIAA